jgi:acyl-CoA reductase-like NAD-dependent aldehyde dehydrogenase
MESGNFIGRMQVDGASVPSSSDEVVDVEDPYSGEKIGTIPVGTEADVNRAVRSARAAFEDGRWTGLPQLQKKRVLHKFADLINERGADLDALDAEEMGKPVQLAFGNASAAADIVRFHAEAVDKILGDVFSSGETSFIAQTRVPRGVIAGIIPWNFPTINAVLKIAPALATGNCLIVKPSELSSRSSILLCQLALEAGLPAGVLNVIPGLGRTVGRALALHNDIDMLAFTGSTDVGKQMQKLSSESNMKRVLAECGGKSAQIVLDKSVDLDTVAESIGASILTNQGQWCSAGSRLLVHESVELALIEKVIQRFERIDIGDPRSPTVTFGPLVNSAHCGRVLRQVELARQDGAEIAFGGQRLQERSGCQNFISPTLLRRVRYQMEVSQEEIFGPVLSVTTFREQDEALFLANSTRFGLVETVWTESISAGMRFSRKIRAGIVSVNAAPPLGEGSLAVSIEPFGQSGSGTELGLGGMESYLRRQVVWMNHG